jgi:hypothetical protein
MDSPYLGIGLLVLIMTGKIVVWEDDLDCWDGLPLDWALDGAFGEALAIRDAMEEEFQRDKMIWLAFWDVEFPLYL